MTVAGAQPATAGGPLDPPKSEARRALDAMPVRFSRHGMCRSPDRRPVLDGSIGSGTHVDLWPCHDCAWCSVADRASRLNRRRKKTRRQIIAECETSRSTHFLTFTLDFPGFRRFLTDRRDPYVAKHDNEIVQLAKQNMMKRARRQGAPAFRLGSAREPHMGERSHQGGDGANHGRFHFHVFIHAKKTHTVVMRFAAASYVWPHGMRLPKRRTGEGEHRYWTRVVMGDKPNKRDCKSQAAFNTAKAAYDANVAAIIAGDKPWTPSDGLGPGGRRWRAIAKDDSEAARVERLRLPFQAGNFNCDIVEHAAKAGKYASKTARYVTEGDARWSSSPGYGGPWPRPTPAAAGPASQEAHGGAGHDHRANDTLGVAYSHICQERGLQGAQQEPPKPPQTGPPSGQAQLHTNRWQQESGPTPPQLQVHPATRAIFDQIAKSKDGIYHFRNAVRRNQRERRNASHSP